MNILIGIGIGLLILLGLLLIALIYLSCVVNKNNKNNLDLNAEIEQKNNKIEELENNIKILNENIVGLEKDKSKLEERINYYQNIEQKNKQEFENLATEILEKKTNKFKEQNKEELKTILEPLKTKITDFESKVVETYDKESKDKISLQEKIQKIFEERTNNFKELNKEEINIILDPLKNKITEFEKKVAEAYDKETRDKISLKEQIQGLMSLNKQLSSDANNLANALKGDNKAQGLWGEIQLEIILEKAGLQKDIHFFSQQSYTNSENRDIRPDFIIKLPDEKCLVIDSKVSLVDYDKFFNEQDKAEKNQHLKNHLASIEKHIKELSEKKYQNIDGLNQPDYVFMFIPIEPAFWLALQKDDKLIEKALKRNVVLVSITNLIATLRIISMVWKQDSQKKNVDAIAKEGGALYDKFVNFLEDMSKIDNNIKSLTKNYDEAMKKLKGKGNIIKKTEKLKVLGADNSKQIEQKYLEQED